MKKTLKSIFCICFASCSVFLLSACGARLEGTYSLYSITTVMGSASITLTIDEYNELDEKFEAGGTLTVEENAKYQLGLPLFGKDMKLIFEAGGICRSSMQEEGQAAQIQSGTYTRDGENLVISIGEDENQEATFKEGAITLNASYANLFFKKEV